MNTQHRLRMSMKHFLIFTGVMLLPGLGGVLDFFDPKKAQLDAIHIACVVPYILYVVFLSKLFSRKIEVSDSSISITDWFHTSTFKLSAETTIKELILFEEDHGTMRHQFIPHFFVGNPTKQELIRTFYIQRYDDLKKALENRLGSKIEVVKSEKSSLDKSIELLERLGIK